MFSHFKTFGLLVSLCLASVLFAAAQDEKTQEKPKKVEKIKPAQAVDFSKLTTADQVAESTILIYGGLIGRQQLQQIRRTTIEVGKTVMTNTDGKSEQIPYTKRILRGENLEKERIRVDQEISGSRYSLIYNGGTLVGLFNETVFTPKDEAVSAFQNQLWRGLEALLRYKENGSTVALSGREKYMNVEYYILDVTDKQNRQTRFFISTKTLRVMALEYTEDAVKYARRFYDYRYAQGTLVPYRTTLSAGDKQIEESVVSTVTYGQKIEEDIFQIG
ncbi:MAG TPA: hypothetical protein VF721_09250 [Pyrinomonadaceae bacterium]